MMVTDDMIHMWREPGDKSIQCVYFNNVILLVAALSYSGIKPSYYLVYDIFSEAIEAVSVTWPTFYVSFCGIHKTHDVRNITLVRFLIRRLCTGWSLMEQMLLV